MSAAERHVCGRERCLQLTVMAVAVSEVVW